MKKQRPSKRASFFSPSVISTRIAEALESDLSNPLHVYRLDEASLFAIDRQKKDFLKKFTTDDKSHLSELEVKAFEKFKAINDHVGSAARRLDKLAEEDDTFRLILEKTRAIVGFVLSDFTEEELFLQCRNGTGSSIGVPYLDTSDERKFRFPITVTKRASLFFDRYLDFDFQLKSAIYNLNRGNNSSRYQFVEGSLATTVPKTSTELRFIAIEPTANMFLQQGLMSLFYERLKVVGLDVECLQEHHKQRARMASVSRREATIDWSSASDCVVIELLWRILPPKWFNMVWSLRSDYITFRGEKVELNMISTMGNATTFPIETLVFWAIGHAARLVQSKKTSLFPEWKDLKKVSVFGDDCIVSTRLAPFFIESCTRAGFIINDDKSFISESQSFRESCGGDYLSGRDVRPFHLKAPTSCRKSALEPWLYIIMNSLFKKYITYFGVTNYIYEKELFRVFSQLFSEYNLCMKIVPPDFPDDSGFKINHDYERLAQNYDFSNWSEHIVDMHGTHSFLFCRFVYRQSYRQDPMLRLALWYKRPYRAVRKPLHKNYIRRKGGYVVARALRSM